MFPPPAPKVKLTAELSAELNFNQNHKGDASVFHCHMELSKYYCHFFFLLLGCLFTKFLKDQAVFLNPDFKQRATFGDGFLLHVFRLFINHTRLLRESGIEIIDVN